MLALRSAAKISRLDLFWDPQLKAAILGHLDREDEAAGNLKLLYQLLPDADNQVKNIVESFPMPWRVSSRTN